MTLTFRIAAAAVLLAASGSAHAALITQTLGTANFANGTTAIGTGNFAPASPTDPAPFDRLIGDKNNGPAVPSASFTFSGYGTPAVGTIASASLTFGLYDGASPTPSTEVNTFTLGTTSLGSALTADLVATNAVRNGEIYYTVDLPSTTFATLASGTAPVTLALQGQGQGLFGPSNFILFGLDFATLNINTQSVTPPPTVPEPASAALLGAGLLGLVTLRRRRRRG